MLLDYFVVGFTALGLFALAMLLSQTMLKMTVSLMPRRVRMTAMDVYESGARQVRRFYRWLYLKDWDYSQTRPNRKLSPKEIMEREALRRGICPDCGVDAKKRGGKNALGGPCPYHTDF